MNHEPQPSYFTFVQRLNSQQKELIHVDVIAAVSYREALKSLLQSIVSGH